MAAAYLDILGEGVRLKLGPYHYARRSSLIVRPV